MKQSDASSLATRTPTIQQGNILLYLPWEFDMLGGVDVVVDRLWKGLEKAVPGKAIIGIQDWHQQGEKTDAEGRRFLHLNMPAPMAENGPSAWRYRLSLAKWLPRLLRTLNQHQITVINVHFPTPNTYVLAQLKHLGLWRGRLVLSFHGSDVNEIDSTSAHWRLIARQTDAVTACSGALAKRVDDLALFLQPTTVIYNGIDCGEFASQGEIAAELPKIQSPYLLNVGNYVSNKGQDIFLRAFARLAPFHPDIHVIFAGGTNNGAWLQQLKELITSLQIGDRVTFLENQPQSCIAALMAHAECLVHTSHREGFPLVLLEAAACCTPIIATRVGGIPEIIPSNDFGLLIDPGDVESVASMLRQVLNSPDQAKSMAESLQQRVEQMFSVDIMTNTYQDTLAGNIH